MNKLFLPTLISGLLLLGTPAFSLPADVDAGFTDVKTTKAKVVQALNKANKSIYIAIFSLNEPDIIRALVDARKRGVVVQVKYDYLQSTQEVMTEALTTLKNAGVVTSEIRMSGRSYMHHKFAVIDGRMVVTGSFNWTRNASFNNWENVVIIQSEEVAKMYKAEWDRIKTWKKGSK